MWGTVVVSFALSLGLAPAEGVSNAVLAEHPGVLEVIALQTHHLGVNRDRLVASLRIEESPSVGGEECGGRSLSSSTNQIGE